MKKILQNRRFLGCLALLLAAALCFGLAPMLKKASLQEAEVKVSSGYDKVLSAAVVLLYQLMPMPRKFEP